MMTLALILVTAALFVSSIAFGLAYGRRTNLKQVEGVVRRHLAEQLREYAERSEKLSMSDVMRIVEGKQ